jgi:zinc and cadmium transporter
LHNFADGVLIAAAFLTDVRLGILTALTVVTHEVPQEVGDYIVLVNAGFSKRKALIYNVIAGCGAVLGGVLGYIVLEQAKNILPYLLVFSSASFLYVAVADLIPQMQRRMPARELVSQLFFITLGIAIIYGMTTLLHVHTH